MNERANDNIPKEVAFALSYLKTGGLAEVSEFADIARTAGQPKVQMDTDMAIALCMMAAESLNHFETPQ